MALPDALQTRIDAAKQDRAKHQAAINDYLRFADPVQPRIGDTSGQTRADEAADIYDPIMQEVGEDFASDTLHRIMPRHANWVRYAPEEIVDKAVQQALKDPLEARTKNIFAAIRASNFYSEAGTDWALHLGHGTAALTCNDYGAGEPLCFEAIGPHQLLIERGAKGKLSFKGREYKLPLEEAFATYEGSAYQWPKALRDKLSDKSHRRSLVCCIEAATRVYDPGGERWTWQVAVDGHIIHESELTGRGSCPIIVTRWRSTHNTAWGVGPLRKAVPDAKSLDQLRYLLFKNMGKQVDPPVVYDDDGTLNPEGGVGPGMWIPRVPGSKIEQLEPMGKLDVAYFEAANLQDAVRRAGYQGGPHQRGKTPPTFGQWMDERNEQGRRLEHPTGKLYEEGAIAILERVEYLLVKRGEIDEIVQAGQKAIRVKPQNPLAKAQEGERVTNASNLLNMWRATLDAQAVAATVDTTQTMENMKNAMDDDLIVLRKPEVAAEMMRGVLGQPGMAPGLETAPEGGQ